MSIIVKSLYCKPKINIVCQLHCNLKKLKEIDTWSLVTEGKIFKVIICIFIHGFVLEMYGKATKITKY